MSLIIPPSSDGGLTVDVTIAAQDSALNVNSTIVGQTGDVDVNVTNPTLIDIARGTVTGSTAIVKYGELVATGAVTSHVIWNDGPTYTIPAASGLQMSVVSSSVQDGPAGTGIRSLRIYYLDASLVQQYEDVTMNGTTTVTTTATNIRFINDVIMLTYGTDKHANGNITISNGGTTYAYIASGNKTSNSSMFMVPYGKRLMVNGLSAGASSGSAASKVLVKIAISNYAGHDYSSDSIFIPVAAIALQDNSAVMSLNSPMAISAGVVFGMLATTDKAATIVGSWFGWLEDV